MFIHSAMGWGALAGSYIVQWAWLAGGVAGLAALVCALIFAPAVTVPIVQAVMRFLITTRPGWGLMFGLAAFIAADIHRANLDQRDWEKAQAAFKAAEQARDAKIASDTKAEVMQQIADQKAADTATDKQVTEFEHGLPPVPNLSDCFGFLHVGADADKLRAIGGEPASKPPGRKRVPKARRPNPGPQN